MGHAINKFYCGINLQFKRIKPIKQCAFPINTFLSCLSSADNNATVTAIAFELQMEGEKANIQQVRPKLNIVVVSDTHGSYKQLNKILQMKGDIFIHAGDFTDYGREKDFIAFFKYLEKLNFRYKIVISGNHEIILDNGCIHPQHKAQYLAHHPCSLSKDQIVTELKKRCIYLEHESVQIEGVRIFGSPYSPYFVGNAFQYPVYREKVIWDYIPQKVDLLVTHCPPFKILDLNSEKKSSGSVHLREVVLARKPKYHVFGHIHESAGMYKLQGVIFLNVANEPTRILI